MDGGDVWERWLAADIGSIRDYCECDVLNTYLVFLRFQLLRGRLTPSAHEAAVGRVRDLLKADGREHLRRFDTAWHG
jgi:predicted PolB exonuclease-like 3'-5' exonuclease